MRVALHICCGPCASACAPRLKDDGHDTVLFFSNSNIDTWEEFDRRLAAARTLAAADGLELAVDTYDHADWLEKVAKGFEDAPERGERCARCFRYNLARAAAFAAARGLDAFTTSLTVSPHKVSAQVFAAGRAAAHTVAGCDAAAPGGAGCDAAAPDGAGCAAAAPGGTSSPAFLPVDFKKKDGFLRSLRRTAELGLYRQSFCGCEFSRAART